LGESINQTGKKILVCGGAGYIGAHCCVALLEAGFEPVIYDNMSNPLRHPAEAIAAVTGKPIKLIHGDVRDGDALDEAFATHDFWAVIHLAALKSVLASLTNPFSYYSVNVSGTVSLLNAMERHNVSRLVYSSSAAVYGKPDSVPVKEDASHRPGNPYAATKAAVEEMLGHCHKVRGDWSIVSLRYFNPAGAHESSLLGEEPHTLNGNLMPWILQAASGETDYLSVFGGDYPTRDGTCIRDYVHVMDIAEGHVAALQHLEQNSCLDAFNLGMGEGTSVLELVSTFSNAIDRPIPWQIVPRRAGDIAETWADISRAKSLLQWAPSRSLHQICIDAWRWRCHRAIV
jgi:UDP-glucose 4-epimerase